MRNKDKSPVLNPILTQSFTPQPSKLSSTPGIPFTEGRSRRTAATKADKYIDIVSRRLAEVPANGSTPKSMKIASKLILTATPNSRRNILLLQHAAARNNSNLIESSTKLANTNVTEKIIIQQIDTPQATISNENIAISNENISMATPISVRKRNRTAKINSIFETRLMSLATAAESNNGTSSASALSPAAINVAPNTITRVSKLNQVSVKALPKKTSPLKEVIHKRQSLVKKVSSPIKKSSQKSSPLKDRVPPIKKSSPKTSPVKLEIQIPQKLIPSTPSKVSLVEFVAPQSVLRSSKRPRKQTDSSIYEDAPNSPVHKKFHFADASIFPTVSINNQSNVKMTPVVAPAVKLTLTQPQASQQNTTRVSNVSSNVSEIIVNLAPTTIDNEGHSSNEDLTTISLAKRTPLRVQPSRTPTRSKAVIPSLSDYSAAAKISVIEISKNNNPATPKVEPWTNRFIQKDKDKDLPVSNAKSAFNIIVKPVDTSKISGFNSSTNSMGSSAPIVPKFPLNLANISNITKYTNTNLNSSINLLNFKSKDNQTSTTASATTSTSTSASASISTTTASIPPPESPLTRAKRIDSENTSREEKYKNYLESKSDKLKRAIGELRSSDESESELKKQQQTASVKMAEVKEIDTIKPEIGSKSVNIKSDSESSLMTTIEQSKSALQIPISATTITTSKLPVKPKSAITVLPSPKIPSRLAEAFSGIDSELPPIDIGLVEDEKILKKTGSNSGSNINSISGFINPKMKKIIPTNTNESLQVQVKQQQLNTSTISVSVSASSQSQNQTSNNSNSLNVTNANTGAGGAQLHRTAVLNSAARKLNVPSSTTNLNNVNETSNPKLSKLPSVSSNKSVQAPAPSTPKPKPSINKIAGDNSSPVLPEIHSEYE